MLALLCMIYLHLLDDYKIQGWLADGKNKYWWQKNCQNKKYSKDYIIALLEHSFMNTFFVHIPVYLFLYNNINILVISVMIGIIFHAIVDDLKANKHKINLIQDQMLHIIYIIVIWFIFK